MPGYFKGTVYQRKSNVHYILALPRKSSNLQIIFFSNLEKDKKNIKTISRYCPFNYCLQMSVFVYFHTVLRILNSISEHNDHTSASHYHWENIII